ncbi:MAG: hypothetical protein JSW60_08115 [Thermoplasmatales archaeon]|nr:MAG: hypothetical protein JSW60_08115 [Thermoplasmatales archaeon]
MITSGEGKFKVWLEEKKIGDDLLYVLGGGERTHIGGIVFCEPNKEPRIIRLPGHYDDVVLKSIAEAACKKYGTRVVATGGVHIENATKDEIEKIVENCRELEKCI